MFNGDDTHEGTETEYWEMTESTEVLQKGSHGGSKSSGSVQHEWHEAPGVVHVRAKKRSELVLLLPDAVFYGERLPGRGGGGVRNPAGRHHLGGGGVDAVSDER
jgi:hypothetical protein